MTEEEVANESDADFQKRTFEQVLPELAGDERALKAARLKACLSSYSDILPTAAKGIIGAEIERLKCRENAVTLRRDQAQSRLNGYRRVD